MSGIDPPLRPASSSISACIVCRNEADRLGPCLDSVQWADEVLMLDLESTDGSAKLARDRGARVISHSAVPIVELVRNHVAAEANGDWILVLDPDERVSRGLGEQLGALRERADLDAVVVPRMNIDLGYPPSNPIHRYEQQLRMYRRSKVSWPTAPNALPEVPAERLYRVPAKDELVLVHERSRTIPEVLDRIMRYAPAHAQDMIARGDEFSAREMLRVLLKEAHLQFVHGKAWTDGVPGFLRAGMLLTFHFYVWAAFWQASGHGRTQADDRLMRRLGRAAEATWSLWRSARSIQRFVRRSLPRRR